MRILQLGKFYPVRGGVEKVMYDLTLGLSERGIPCDMLCATKEVEPGVSCELGKLQEAIRSLPSKVKSSWSQNFTT